MVRTSPPTTPERTEREADGDDSLLRRLREGLRPEFEILRHLGEESFGSLFLAREIALRRLVVVKVLGADHARAPDIRRRFAREALAVAHIAHPNVVPIFRVGKLDDGTPYFVEPYLGECTIGERLNAVRRFEPAQVRHVLRDVASALVAAHQRGIVHRGIHPGALRCEEGSERVVLTDFGLSGLMESVRLEEDRLTPSGEIFGSAGYMSPEQMTGHAATDRSDVYAVGLIGWRLLAGAGASFPFPDARPSPQWQAWEETVSDPPLTDLIRRCLAVEPHDRPSAEDVVRELAAAGEHGPAGSVTNKEKVWVGLRRRRIPHAFLIYAPAGWVALQVVDQLVQQGLLPRRMYLLALCTVVAGLPAALVLAWHHGARGPQRATATELWLLGGIVVAWLVALATVWTGA